jgi:flagellar motility protein MotE (MotC chaperone)
MTKKKGLSKEQATELYKDLQRSMAKMLKNEAEYYNSKGVKTATPDAKPAKRAVPARSFLRNVKRPSLNSGSKGAVTVLVAFALAKVVVSGLEFSGLASVSKADASYINMATMPKVTGVPAEQFSKEEIQVLTSLDSRRAELEQRNHRLDEREQDIQRKDKEFALRITQLRELNDKLKSERDKNDKKQTGQLDQLANVYGSMNPDEAAKLMEQLDIVTAMSLIERMPEKRIGQILSSMTAERALEITRMLSGKK